MKILFDNLQKTANGYSIDASAILSGVSDTINAISLQVDYSQTISIDSIIPSAMLPSHEFFVANPSFLGKKSFRVGWFSNESFTGGVIFTINFKNSLEFNFNLSNCDIANSNAESYSNIEYINFK